MTSLLVAYNMNARRQQRTALEVFRHEGIKQVEIVETLQKCIQTRHCPSVSFVTG